MTTPTTTPVPTPAQLFLPRTHVTLMSRQVLLSALPPNEALGCDPPERALVTDITALGVLQPVLLVQTPAGGYTVGDGRSRIWAARLGGGVRRMCLRRCASPPSRSRDVLGVGEDLHQVVARAEAQLFQRRLQGHRAGPSKPRANNLQHDPSVCARPRRPGQRRCRSWTTR
jgi:hypothetical protein